MGLITEYKYDSLSNMTEQISPKGAVTKYDYDKHGNVISVTDAKGNEGLSNWFILCYKVL